METPPSAAGPVVTLSASAPELPNNMAERTFSSSGPGVPRVLGDGAARNTSAGRMPTRMGVSFTIVMLAGAYHGWKWRTGCQEVSGGVEARTKVECLMR